MPNKDTFKQLVSEIVKGIIWKIVLDDAYQILLIESRTEQKEVYFSAFDFNTNSWLMKDRAFEETWFIGISGIYEGIAYFHGFENEFSPGRKGIIAYHLHRQQVIWENYNYVLEYISKEGILVFNSKIQPKKFELLNSDTGLLLKNIHQENLQYYPPISNNILIPATHFDKELANNHQELRIRDLNIRSVYRKEKDCFNHILEIQKGENIIVEEYLERDIQKVAPDTFFVWFDKLVYIKNKSEIVSYLL